jgi:hypothetical protein
MQATGVNILVEFSITVLLQSITQYYLLEPLMLIGKSKTHGEIGDKTDI